MDEPEAFSLDVVNRAVAVITPREPFLQWARTIDDPGRPPGRKAGDSAAFLIPDLGDEGEAREWLREVSADMFRELLAGWCEDQSTWPRSVDSWPLFTAWFEIRYAGEVFDLSSEELFHYDLDGEGADEAGAGDVPGAIDPPG